jgi:hypothetical protein
VDRTPIDAPAITTPHASESRRAMPRPGSEVVARVLTLMVGVLGMVLTFTAMGAAPAAAVDSTISAGSSVPNPPAGQRFTISGSVVASAGQAIKPRKAAIQELRNGKWRSIKSVRIRSNGAFAGTIRFTSDGIRTLRVYKKRSGRSSAAASAPFTVDVGGAAPAQTPAAPAQTPAAPSQTPAAASQTPADPEEPGTAVGGVHGPGIEPQWQVEDTDGDGCLDVALWDGEGNGHAEVAWLDYDNDCAWDSKFINAQYGDDRLEQVWIDLDENGMGDVMFFDGNQDGSFDWFLVDANKDGYWDTADWQSLAHQQSAYDQLRASLMGTVTVGAPTYDGWAGLVIGMAGASGTAVWTNFDNDDCEARSGYDRDDRNSYVC